LFVSTHCENLTFLIHVSALGDLSAYLAQFRSTVLNFAGILKGIQATDEERRDSALSSSAAAVSAELADADNADIDGSGDAAVDFASSVSAAAAALLAVPQRDVSGAASTGVMLQAGWPLLQAILPQILQVRIQERFCHGKPHITTLPSN
jgi:hypothetical protein